MHTLAHTGLVATRVLIAGFGFLLIIIAFLLREEEEEQLQTRLKRLSETIKRREDKTFVRQRELIRSSIALVPLIYEMPGWLELADADLSVRLFFYVGLPVTAIFVFSLSGFMLVVASLKVPYSRQFMAGLLGASHLDISSFLLLIFLSSVVSVLILYGPLWILKPLKSRPVLLLSLLTIFGIVIMSIYAFPFVSGVPDTVFWARTKLFLIASSPAALMPVKTFSIYSSMLISRLLWSLFERPIYAINRHEVIKKRLLLLTTAMVILTWAIPAWKPFWDVVGKLH